MAKYYPKSQIIPNLYASNGANNRVDGTLLLSTTKETYTGFFWATSDGKYLAIIISYRILLGIQGRLLHLH